MEIRANLKGIQRDLLTGETLVTFSTQADAEPFQNLTGELDLKIKKYSPKRSLDANAYAWAIMEKVAKVVKSSKEEVYEEMLWRYGTLERDAEGRNITGNFPHGVKIANLPGHWHVIDDIGDTIYCILVKGSSEYTRAEMSQFIDGLVSDAKELGIETMPPQELERMMNAWR